MTEFLPNNVKNNMLTTTKQIHHLTMISASLCVILLSVCSDWKEICIMYTRAGVEAQPNKKKHPKRVNQIDGTDLAICAK